MLNSLIFLAVSAQGAPQQPPAANAGALISKMFARYASAQSLVGTVRLVQKAGQVSVTVDSVLQFERPSKLYLRQQRKSSDPYTYLVTSDGKVLTYDVPEDARRFAKRPNERLKEPVESSGTALTVGDMYQVAAYSLADRSAPFDIAFGRRDDLKYLTEQWPTFAYKGKVKIGDTEVHAISGQWRLNASSPITGVFDLYVSDEGDLKRYVTRNRFIAERLEQMVESVWDVNLTIGGKTDPALYKPVL